jgi:DNA-binding MarR family transcriptional regulator
MFDSQGGGRYAQRAMIADRVDFGVPYKTFERAALVVLDGAHRAQALSWLDELGQHVEEVIDGGELERVADWSARLDRLAANLPEGDLRDLASGYLAAMLHRLDRCAAALAQRHDVQEREQIAGGVRERVLTWVADHPRSRSGEIAKHVGIAPSQASRALRELQQRGVVFLAETHQADHDKRLHRYVARSTAHAA